jgi:thymidylate kinase
MLSGWLAVNEGGRLKVVAIIAGMGGVGKTTLAKELYYKLRGQFECCAFVRTSRNPDVRELLTNLLLQVQRNQPVDAYEAPVLIKKIRAHLRYRKYVTFCFSYVRLYLHKHTINSTLLPFHP